MAIYEFECDDCDNKGYGTPKAKRLAGWPCIASAS
jgi:hypothetical protein